MCLKIAPQIKYSRNYTVIVVFPRIHRNQCSFKLTVSLNSSACFVHIIILKFLMNHSFIIKIKFLFFDSDRLQGLQKFWFVIIDVLKFCYVFNCLIRTLLIRKYNFLSSKHLIKSILGRQKSLTEPSLLPTKRILRKG